MATTEETHVTLEFAQRGQLDSVAPRTVRWHITTGDTGKLRVEHKADDVWADFGSMAAKDVELHDSPFKNDRWNILEWTNPDHDLHYRLTATGPYKEEHDTFYRLLIQKRTHNDPGNEAYVTIQNVRTTTIPTLTYPEQ